MAAVALPDRRIGEERMSTLDDRIANARSAALGSGLAAAAYVSPGTSEICGPVGKHLAHL
jgi:hypothetical protein